MIYLNNKPVPVTMFPDKTSQVWKLPASDLEGGFAYIRWEFEHEGEFMHLAQLKELLDAFRVPVHTLYLTYLPYGRQDKPVANSATFALRTFCKLLRSLEFKRIVILDPHSDVAMDYLEYAYPQCPVDKVAFALDCAGADLLCYPDAGAVGRYAAAYAELDTPYIRGEKVRDQSTGNIVKYDLVGNPLGHKVLIVDDICDGGMTFKLLTKDLLAAGAKEVSLYVTHGIFSKGTKTLFDSGISRIFTKSGEVKERT